MTVRLCRGLAILALVWLAGGPLIPAASAQGTPRDLLLNGDLETPYYAQGAPTRTVPQGWGLWVGTGLPDALPHKDSPQVHSGAVSWHLRQNGSVFTAAGYQQVSGLIPGMSLELEAHAWAFACDDAHTRCAIATPPYAQSDPAAGVAVRVGIDPTGGLDPLSDAVQWSAEEAPYDRWTALRVTATVQADTVTVYLFMTQQTGLALNSVYWDSVRLMAAAEPLQSASPVPEASPTAMPLPSPTSTPTPLAPLPASLTADTGTLCATLFEDANTNAFRDEGEPPLAGLRLLVTGVERADTFTSNGQSDPLCVELAPGVYEVAALPPEGTGLTGSDSVLITLLAGRRTELTIGAALGYAPPPAPVLTETPSPPAEVDAGLLAPPLASAQATDQADQPLQDQLYDYSGLLVLALAAAVGGGSALALWALRRPA